MVNHLAPLGFAAIAGILSAYSQVAYAGELVICNKLGTKLAVAIAHIGAPDPTPGRVIGYVSRGWWQIDPGGCDTVLQQRETANFVEVYIYAEISSGPRSGQVFIGGNYNYCVNNTMPFFYTNDNRNCTLRGFRQDTMNINQRYTINITPYQGNL
jgi:uncharacterized membrane protein